MTNPKSATPVADEVIGMRRRELMLLLGGAMVAACALRAEQKAISVVGYLTGGTAEPSPAPLRAAFYQGLSKSGYVQGQNLAIEYRWAEGHYDRLPALAADLVDRKVDVIAAIGGVSIRAAKNTTSTIPIVSSPATRPLPPPSPVSRGRAATSRASAP
jgi:putative ABC transport system substrate-binding protein